MREVYSPGARLSNYETIKSDLAAEGINSANEWKEVFELDQLDLKDSEEILEKPDYYNITRYGINELDLNQEEVELLDKIHLFLENITEEYHFAMQKLMAKYQQKNPRFTNEMIRKMTERGYTVPELSIYQGKAADDFLQHSPELDLKNIGDNFLINLQLPKPLARFWYRGGEGKGAEQIPEGNIEWGYFYRIAMYAIYFAVDKASEEGLYLNRLNAFGQHDKKKYYYLYEVGVD